MEVLQELLDSRRPEYAKFSINGRLIDCLFEVSNNSFRIRPNKTRGRENTCVLIKVKHEEKLIELVLYYALTPILQCPYISHKSFFELLDVFSAVFGYDLELEDASTKYIESTVEKDTFERGLKDIETCSIDFVVMALAKGKTFYNRYGECRKVFIIQMKVNSWKNHYY